MYEQLLVGLDGSPGAERVLEHVEAIAGAFGSTVTLVRVIESEEMLVAETSAGPEMMSNAGTFIDPTPIMDADRDVADAYLHKVAARLRAQNLTVNIERLEGPTSDAIVECAKTIGASLILMTTHGRAGLQRLLLGSVADAVLRHAPCPLFLLRQEHADDDNPTSG